MTSSATPADTATSSRVLPVYELGFPTGRDSATFPDNGTEVPSLSQDKGTTGQKFLYCPGTKGQAKNLAKGWDGLGQPKSGTRRGTGRGTKRDRGEKDVLKQKKDIQKQKMTF